MKPANLRWPSSDRHDLLVGRALVRQIERRAVVRYPEVQPEFVEARLDFDLPLRLTAFHDDLRDPRFRSSNQENPKGVRMSLNRYGRPQSPEFLGGNVVDSICLSASQ